MNGYRTNDCGVVMNPDVVFKFMPKNALAWLYWEIKVGICDNNLWDNGYSHGGGGSPCCIGSWNTKEEAIKDAILIFKEHFNLSKYFSNSFVIVQYENKQWTYTIKPETDNRLHSTLTRTNKKLLYLFYKTTTLVIVL